MSDAVPGPITLAASLDLTAADGLRRDLSAALSDGGIAVDGLAVERVSTPCLQVLAAAAATARARGYRFVLSQPSDVLRTAIADLGLHQAIPCED